MNVDEPRQFYRDYPYFRPRAVLGEHLQAGVTKGQHWHHTKNEKFVVVSGHGLIQLRKIGTEEIVSFEVNGGRMEVVEMIPGYTHNIVNLSETEDLVTFMWCNECFDPARPDTYFEKV